MAQADTGVSSRVAFSDSIKVVGTSTSSGHAAITRMALRTEESSAQMTVEVALRMRNFSDLQNRVSQGEQISSTEMDATYYPTKADHEGVRAWIESQGLKVSRTDDDRLAIFATGSVDTVARAFQVTFGRVAKDGGEYTSATTTPSLPSEQAAPSSVFTGFNLT